MKAYWKNQLLAESNTTQILEGNHYFPPSSIRKEYFIASDHSSVCPLKGQAAYYDIKVGEKVNPAAAWYYPHLKPGYEAIAHHIAFWKGVEILP